jgi:DNA polymerase III epsilon subunit-like protein
MPISHSKFSIVDYETGGTGPGRQPLSIGIVILDARRLTIADNGTFYSLIRPSDPEDLESNGLDPIDPKALAVNKLDPKDLAAAPTAQAVWENVKNFMKYHNTKADKWNAPIFTGWNTAFDFQITERMIRGHLPNKLMLQSKLIPKKDHKELGEKELAKAYKGIKLMKEPYGFGGETLFRPFPTIDVAQVAFMMFESLREPEKLNLDAVKAFLGFKSEGAHNALVDCLWTAEIWVRYLQMFRQIAPEVDYQTEGNTVLDIQKYTKDFKFESPIIDEVINVPDEVINISPEECPF